MKRHYVSITQRGQVTLPAEIRRLLRLKPRDQVIFEVENDEIRVVRPTMTLEETFGSVTPLSRPEDFKRMTREAWEEKIERDRKKLRKA